MHALWLETHRIYCLLLYVNTFRCADNIRVGSEKLHYLPHWFTRFMCKSQTLNPWLLLPNLQDLAPLTALSFSANGAGLITANASNHIAVYNVETLSVSDWTRIHGSHLPSRLLNMPGSIVSISVHPQVGFGIAPQLIVHDACGVSLAQCA